MNNHAPTEAKDYYAAKDADVQKVRDALGSLEGSEHVSEAALSAIANEIRIALELNIGEISVRNDSKEPS